MIALAPRSRRVGLVTADAATALAKRALEALVAARLEVQVVAVDDMGDEGIFVLLDDPSLPQALARLILGLPRRELLPNVVLVTNNAGRGGLLLAEGFRDVVAPADAGHAVHNLLSERPPVVHEHLLLELQERFLPALATELKLRASEADRLLVECIALVKANAFFARHLARLEKVARRQGIDEAYIAIGHVEAFASQLETIRRPRPYTLRRFPVSRLSKTTLGTGEPRLGKRDKTLVSDAIAWLDNAELIASLPAGARAELDGHAREQAKAPIAALRACIDLVERERQGRLARIQSLHQGPEPSVAVESWLREQHGFEVLPPGFALPAHQVRLIRSHVQPPPEIYTTWCLDLVNMRLTMTSEVLGAIARELGQSGQSSIWARRAPNHTPENARKEQ